MFDAVIPVSKELYSSTAVLKAAYTFLNSAYFRVSDNGSKWEVSIRAKKNDDLQQIIAEFENELIAQAVRERVFKQTKSIREMLFARAITSTMIDTENSMQRIQDENNDISEAELDDILKSWFEQHEVD